MAIVAMIFGLAILVILKSKVQRFDGKDKQTACIVEGKKYRIAIMLQMTHPALEEIEQGFLETLNGSIAYSYDIFNANGDRSLMRQQAEEVAAKNYDLVFTIPTTPSLIMKEVCLQRGKEFPIVAGAVDDPVAIKLVESMQSSGNNITAVTGIDTFEQQIEMLVFLKPTLKNILLVYNPTPGLDAKKDELCSICSCKGIGFKTVEIFNMSDLIQKVPNFTADCDTIMVLKDNMVVSGIESLVNLCNRAGKTLYASDLNSGDKGAALSYGVREYQDGVESALKAIEILKNGKKPTDVPSSATTKFKIKINTKTAREQGLKLSPELLLAMQSGEII